ncbi:MAG TPA: NAD(P)-binding domain-containing protein [Candidatus Tectomicrobia bacterium]
MPHHLPIAIIGAGPVGLAAAAHLLARGETPLVFEAGHAIGQSIRAWAHVRVFSPWGLNVDQAAATLLTAAGWKHPPKETLPTGGEFVEQYLEPLASLPEMRRHIHVRTRVIGVTRKGYDKVRTADRAQQPFVVRISAPDGQEQAAEAKAIIDASGTWTSPNPAGADGLPAIGECAAADRIFYGIPDVLGALRPRYAGQTTMVVGSGHSALTGLLELAELKMSAPDTRILWIMRKPHFEAAFGGDAADALPARGALGMQARALVEGGAVQVVSPFRIHQIERQTESALCVIGDHAGVEARIDVDQIIVATGFRPDFSFLREIRLSVDPWLESSGTIGPLIDPNLHSCGTVRPHGAMELAHPEPGFFIVGMKSYGRAPTFLLATGYEQVRSVVAALTGDVEAAMRVVLQLPETGVCSTRPLGSTVLHPLTLVQAASCCGGPAPAESDACCVQDAEAKATGQAGCGCGSVDAAAAAPAPAACGAKAGG